MQLGIHLPHIGRKAGPAAIRRAAIQAEALGFDDVWVSEHIIVPAGAPYPPSPLFFDPVLSLTWAAAATRRVRLGTSVLVLPLRHPLPLAKELATLQCLSEGRLILGAGAGWLEAEFAALGVPFRERGRRLDEGLAMMRAVWSEDPVSFPARAIAAEIAAMRMLPQPSAPIPVWIGGGSEAALARALRHQGWHGSRIEAAALSGLAARLRAQAAPGFTISVRLRHPEGATADGFAPTLAAYAAAGADHAMVEPQARGLEAWLAAVEQVAAARAIAGL
ncbi:MAG: TIGR03619 family F420-dependent LLM class oxidoreductase [Rhodospirillales bacterium]|nr:TIGR03619 family F420-dependent LLM class oxidoreductase [Rhodospirillales bacterium]